MFSTSQDIQEMEMEAVRYTERNINRGMMWPDCFLFSLAFFFLLKYSVSAMLYWLQVCSIVTHNS